MKSDEFHLFFAEHAQDAYRIARGILNNPEDAEDAVQEALMKIIETHGSFREEAKISTWIFTIVRNTCLTRTLRPDRVRARQVPLESADKELDHSMDLWELADEDPDSIRWHISRLPEREATAIRLHYFRNHKYRQIATMMGISMGAVAQLLSRGRGHLHVLITETRKDKAV